MGQVGAFLIANALLQYSASREKIPFHLSFLQLF